MTTNAAMRTRMMLANHPARYRAGVCALVAVAQCALIFSAELVPALSSGRLLGPAAGTGPVFALFFGLPGIVGCLIAEVASAVLTGAFGGLAPAALTISALRRVISLSVPYLLWYVLQRGAADPHPRLTCARNLAVYLGVSSVYALLLAAVSAVLDPAAGALGLAIVGLNGFTFAVYLGMPLLVALERSPLFPVEPRRAAEAAALTYRKYPRITMTQRMALAGVFASIGVILVMTGLYLAPYPFYQEYGRLMSDVAAGVYALTTIFTVLVFVPMVGALHFLETRYIGPVESVTRFLTTFLAQVREGKAARAKVDLAGVRPLGEVRDLIDASEQLRSDLVDHIDRLARAMAEQERSDAELDVARRMQRGVIPEDFGALRARGLDVYGFMRPARQVGGDFYDVFEMGEGRIGLVIGDVSGKGVPAALFMMRAVNELRYQMVSCADLGEAFTRANEGLYLASAPEVFVTAFACSIDVRTGELAYVNAGHNQPWLHREDGGSWLACDAERPLGAFSGHKFAQKRLALGSGDGMLLYTDGITEACHADGDRRLFFGSERLERVVRGFECAASMAGATTPAVREVLEGVACAAVDFAQGEPQADDMTMLGFVRL